MEYISDNCTCVTRRKRFAIFDSSLLVTQIYLSNFDRDMLMYLGLERLESMKKLIL